MSARRSVDRAPSSPQASGSSLTRRRPFKRRGVTTLVAGTAALAVLLSACSSSSKKASDTGTGGSSATGSTIKIGLIGGMSGAIAYPDRLSAAKAAVAGINARGGLGGHPIDLISCDDKSTANDATACAREMITNKVMAVAGDSSATEDALVTSLLEAAGIPQVGIDASSSQSLNSKLVYEPLSSYRIGYAALTAYGAKALNGPVSAVEFDVPAIASFAADVKTALAPSGITFGNTVMVPPTQADYSPLVAAAARNGAKSALLAMPVPSVYQFMKTDASTGSTLKYLVPSVLAASSASSAGGVGQLDRVISFSQLPVATADSSNPVIAQYIKEMKAEQDKGDSLAALSAQEGGMIPWFAFYTLEQVVKQTHLTNFTAAGLASALDSAKNINLGGLVPNWTPRAPGIPGNADISNTTYYIVGYKDGNPYLITPNGVTLANAFAGKFS